MSKFARTAAFVVGAAALIASGVGALAGASIIGATAGAGAAAGATAGFLGVSAATFTAVGAIAGVASAALSLAAGQPKGSVGGSATQFKIDKDAGMPVIIGRSPAAHRVIRIIAKALRPPEPWSPPTAGVAL